MTEYKEIEMKEALMRYADGEMVYFRYFTNSTYAWIGSLGLDHLRRNPERYTFYIEEPKAIKPGLNNDTKKRRKTKNG